jgi:hypothetical protein
MAYLMIRIPEIFKAYNDGLTTQMESLNLILSAVTVAIYKHSDKIEETLFRTTGKRPYEHGL